MPKAGTPLAGRTLRGGLIFAGVDGAPEEQGDLPAIKVAPRAGITYALSPRTVIRSGYGTFYAPWQYNASNHGQIGFSRITALSQSSADIDVPITTLDNPFPAGLQQPIGSSLGLLTGVGGDINYIDQDKGAPIVHQYSADVQHELPGDMAVTIGYMGATGRNLGFAGTNNVGLNINQIDPAVARQVAPAPGGGWDAAALRQSVPNPFFGIAQAGELGTRATVPLGQLLRPFPQFGNVNVFERTDGGKRQYNAITLVLDKRVTRRWWGGRYSYTWSRLKDNQFGEDSAYQTRTSVPQNVYDLDAEYAISNFDSPHRIVLAPIVRFPNPSQHANLLGGWTASAIIELVSGSPLNAVMSEGTSDANLGLLGGRQRPNASGDPNTSGSDADRVSSADHPDARWFNAGAFQDPGAGRYGTASRTVRRRTLPVPEESGFRHYERHALRQERRSVGTDPVRDPQPDQHREVQRIVSRQLGRPLELRTYHIAAGLHAHLAAQFPLCVLRVPRCSGANVPKCQRATVLRRGPDKHQGTSSTLAPLAPWHFSY